MIIIPAMMMTQDDLFALQNLRLVAGGCSKERQLAASAMREYPGRAAGRHCLTSLDRTMGILATYGRRNLCLSENLIPSVDERRLLSILQDLRAGRHQAATDTARFLVRETGVQRLLDAMAPAAMLLPPQGTGALLRRNIRTA